MPIKHWKCSRCNQVYTFDGINPFPPAGFKCSCGNTYLTETH